MRGHWRIFVLAMVASGCLASAAVQAQARHLRDAPRADTFGESGAASRDRIIESIQRQYNARVVRVTDISVNGRPAMELRLLSADRVWTVRVDSASGQVIQGSN
jgi:uncharacterized membrane protein YkoI